MNAQGQPSTVYQILLILFAAACDGTPRAAGPPTPPGDPGGAPGKGEAGVTSDCTAWTTVVIEPFRFVNDQWGQDKAQEPFEQCLLTREGTSPLEVGWTWHWPGFEPTVYAYPSATFGWKPWAGGTPTDERFPIQLSDLVRLDLDYAVETEATEAYNLAPELWLTSSGTATSDANPAIITHEVMFWLEGKGNVGPAGSIIAQPTLHGTTYQLWRADDMGVEANGSGWTLWTFVFPSHQRQGLIPMHDFLTYLQGEGFIDADNYVASLEFGNELFGGSGTSWVKRLSVNVEP